jgi:hypothetical protein
MINKNTFFKSNLFAFLCGQLVIVIIALGIFLAVLRTFVIQDEATIVFRSDVISRLVALEGQKKQVDVLKTKVNNLDKEVTPKKK